MIGKLFSVLRSTQAFFGSTLGSMLIAALRKLVVPLRDNDIQGTLRIVRIIERIANTALDVCLKIRASLSDGRIDGQEIESLTRMIRSRISELEGEKQALSYTEE